MTDQISTKKNSDGSNSGAQNKTSAQKNTGGKSFFGKKNNQHNSATNQKTATTNGPKTTEEQKSSSTPLGHEAVPGTAQQIFGVLEKGFSKAEEIMQKLGEGAVLTYDYASTNFNGFVEWISNKTNKIAEEILNAKEMVYFSPENVMEKISSPSIDPIKVNSQNATEMVERMGFPMPDKAVKLEQAVKEQLDEMDKKFAENTTEKKIIKCMRAEGIKTLVSKKIADFCENNKKHLDGNMNIILAPLRKFDAKEIVKLTHGVIQGGIKDHDNIFDYAINNMKMDLKFFQPVADIPSAGGIGSSFHMSAQKVLANAPPLNELLRKVESMSENYYSLVAEVTRKVIQVYSEQYSEQSKLTTTEEINKKIGIMVLIAFDCSLRQACAPEEDATKVLGVCERMKAAAYRAME